MNAPKLIIAISIVVVFFALYRDRAITGPTERLTPSPISHVAVTGSNAETFQSLLTSADELLREKRFVEALSAAERATKVSPEQPDGYYYVSLSYFGLHQ